MQTSYVRAPSGPYAFGWAVKGFKDGECDCRQVMPASLSIQPWLREPDTRKGERPTELKGTLTVTDLQVGSCYHISRWDSVEEAFTYTEKYEKITFRARKDTLVYVDDESFPSNGTTYYQCITEQLPPSEPSPALIVGIFAGLFCLPLPFLLLYLKLVGKLKDPKTGKNEYESECECEYESESESEYESENE